MGRAFWPQGPASLQGLNHQIGEFLTKRQGSDPHPSPFLSKRQGPLHRFGSLGPRKALPHLRQRRKQLIHGDFQAVKGRQHGRN